MYILRVESEQGNENKLVYPHKSRAITKISIEDLQSNVSTSKYWTEWEESEKGILNMTFIEFSDRNRIRQASYS